jgi:hypothetical protein
MSEIDSSAPIANFMHHREILFGSVALIEYYSAELLLLRR